MAEHTFKDEFRNKKAELIENDKPYTVHDVWNLFHRMLSKEYVPYCGHQSNGVPINQALKEVFTCQ